MSNVVRDQIVEAASAVLRETGPAKMRVQEVARRAGVSPTLLYYYFDGKHGLVAATYARDYAAILEEDRMVLREAMGTATDLDELMHHASVLLLDQSAPDRRKQRLAVLATAQVDPVVAEAIQEPNRFHHQQYIDAVEECRSRGWLDDSTDVHAMALLWMSLPFGLIFGDLDPTLSVNMGALFASANAVRAIPQLDER